MYFVEGSIYDPAVPHVCDIIGQAQVISISSTWPWVRCSKHGGAEPGSMLLSLKNL